MKTKNLLSIFCLLGFLSACGQTANFGPMKGKTSRLLSVTAALKDPFEGRVQTIDIQKVGNDLNVCVLRSEGQLACFGSQLDPNYPSFRNLGPLRDFNGRCAVNQNGLMACTLPDSNQRVGRPGPRERIDAVQVYERGNSVCALVENNDGNTIKCYNGSGKEPYAKIQAPKASAGNSNALSAVDIIQFAQTNSRSRNEEIICSTTNIGSVFCKNLTRGIEAGGAGPGTTLLVALSSDNRCLLKVDGSLACYSLADNSAVAPPPAVRSTGLVDLTGRDDTICARYADGDFACWTGHSVVTRARFNNVQKVTKVNGNAFGICAVFADEKIRCLEPNSGSIATYEDLKADFLLASDESTCTVGLNGKSSCWGHELGYEIPQTIPFPAGTEAALGQNHFCFIDDGQVSCIGDNQKQQQAIPVALQSQVAWDLSASNNRTCALTENGAVFCWGESIIPQDVPADLPIAKRVVVGQNASCIIGQDNRVTCWGVASLSKIPQELQAARDITIGKDHICALDLNDQPLCWGDDANGKILPFPIPGGYSSIKAGPNHTCGITKTGSNLLCWGLNDDGQTLVPPSAQIAKSVVLGAYHTCATDARSHVSCWGRKMQSDVGSAFDRKATPIRQEYLGDIFRHIPFGKAPSEICTGAPCNFPAEPVVSFAGLDLTEYSGIESYALYVYFEAQCPVNIILNGNLGPEKLSKVDNETLAEFYGANSPTEVDGSGSGSLVGPALLQIRGPIEAATGQMRPQPSCPVTIKRIAIIPSKVTTDMWKDRAKALIGKLSDGIDDLLAFKDFEGKTSQSYQETAITLNTKILERYLDVAAEAIQEANNLEPPIADLPVISESKELQPLLSTTQKITMFGVEGLDSKSKFDTIVINPMAKMPTWYNSMLGRLSFQTRQNLQSLKTLHSSSRSILNAPFDAEKKSPGKIRQLANQIGRSGLESSLRATMHFISVTDVLRKLLDLAFAKEIDNVIKTVDQSQVDDAINQINSNP